MFYDVYVEGEGGTIKYNTINLENVYFSVVVHMELINITCTHKLTNCANSRPHLLRLSFSPSHNLGSTCRSKKKKSSSRKHRTADSDASDSDSDSSSDEETAAERAKRRKKAKKEKVSKGTLSSKKFFLFESFVMRTVPGDTLSFVRFPESCPNPYLSPSLSLCLYPHYLSYFCCCQCICDARARDVHFETKKKLNHEQTSIQMTCSH